MIVVHNANDVNVNLFIQLSYVLYVLLVCVMCNDFNKCVNQNDPAFPYVIVKLEISRSINVKH